MPRKLTLALIAVICLVLTSSIAKADPVVITFDDVDTTTNAAQPIATNRYASQGVIIRDVYSESPFIFRDPAATTQPNFIASGVGITTTYGDLNINFVFPGSGQTAAVASISFSVVATGEAQDSTWVVYVWHDSTLINGVNGVAGSGNRTYSFSTETPTITGFTISYNPYNSAANRPLNGRVGVDTLGFSSLAQPVPEPATMTLLMTGLAGVGAIARRRRQRKSDSKE